MCFAILHQTDQCTEPYVLFGQVSEHLLYLLQLSTTVDLLSTVYLTSDSHLRFHPINDSTTCINVLQSEMLDIMTITQIWLSVWHKELSKGQHWACIIYWVNVDRMLVKITGLVAGHCGWCVWLANEICWQSISDALGVYSYNFTEDDHSVGKIWSRV